MEKQKGRSKEMEIVSIIYRGPDLLQEGNYGPGVLGYVLPGTDFWARVCGISGNACCWVSGSKRNQCGSSLQQVMPHEAIMRSLVVGPRPWLFVADDPTVNRQHKLPSSFFRGWERAEQRYFRWLRKRTNNLETSR